MSSARLFVKAATPIASSLLILTGVLQLRAQSWTVGGICVVLAMLGFILSIRLLEKTPFTTDELTILLPWMIPVISWAVVVGLITLSVFYVADHFESAQTDRIAAIAWAGSVILGMFIVWGKLSWTENYRSLMERQGFSDF